MKNNNIKLDIKEDTSELKDAIKLVRTLKYEVIELQKKGLSKKIINKIILKKYKERRK